MAKEVYVDGVAVEKAGTSVSPDAAVEVRGQGLPYVSRGGLKLEAALDRFDVSPAGRICLDVGASTGGFTDCLLQRGARMVYAVDVGYGQLAWRLRQDPRVIVRERTNFRHIGTGEIADVELVVVDVSFISLSLIFPAVQRVIVPDADVIALIKPQFEAGRERVGKGGVVKSPDVHRDVLATLLARARDAGWSLFGLCPSPIRGPKGNIEFFGWWRRTPIANDAGRPLDSGPDGSYATVVQSAVKEAWELP